MRHGRQVTRGVTPGDRRIEAQSFPAPCDRGAHERPAWLYPQKSVRGDQPGYVPCNARLST